MNIIKKPIPKNLSCKWLEDNFSHSAPLGREIYDIIKEHVNLKGKKNEISPNEKVRNNIHFDNFKETYIAVLNTDKMDSYFYLRHLQLVFSVVLILDCKYENYDHNEIINFLDVPNYYKHIFDNINILNEYIDYKKRLKHLREIIITRDILSTIYQDSFNIKERQHKGEFYTHPKLAKIMVENSYLFGMRVLDPSCGSGTFLMEIVKKILMFSEKNKENALKNIFGFDINPFSCIMARANLCLVIEQHLENYSQDLLKKISKQILNINTLFPEEHTTDILKKLQNKFDLVIGNPPWIVLNRIFSKKEKEKIKKLGNTMGILRGGRLSTSTELTTIFIYYCLLHFIKDGEHLFFVTPASLVTGSQHSLFRQFAHMKNVEIWDFDQDVFRIHNLCFKAKKGAIPLEERTIVNWKKFKTTENPITLDILSSTNYVPVYIKEKKEETQKKNNNESKKPNPNLLVGRLISAQKKEDYKLLDYVGNSFYHNQFRQGASLVPRNLLFVDTKNISKKSDSPTPNKQLDLIKALNHSNLPKFSNLVKIEPSTSIISKKYSQWDFIAYQDAIVEKKYIFNVAKSTGLLPFKYFKNYEIFLPIEKINEKNTNLKIYIQEPKEPKAKNHYLFLAQKYKENIKKGAKIKNILDRLDYGSALSNPLQHEKIKVVFAGIGTIVKAAIIINGQIIDTSLYYYVPSNLDEAYYLMGYLNSRILTKHLRVLGSTGANGSLRNIHKHPLKLKIPKYDSKISTHQEIVKHSKDLETFIDNFIKSLIKKEKTLQNKAKSIQNKIFENKEYIERLKKLDELILSIFS